jgi:hypothetical protein
VIGTLGHIGVDDLSECVFHIAQHVGKPGKIWLTARIFVVLLDSS